MKRLATFLPGILMVKMVLRRQLLPGEALRMLRLVVVRIAGWEGMARQVNSAESGSEYVYEVLFCPPMEVSDRLGRLIRFSQMRWIGAWFIPHITLIGDPDMTEEDQDKQLILIIGREYSEPLHLPVEPPFPVVPGLAGVPWLEGGAWVPSEADLVGSLPPPAVLRDNLPDRPKGEATVHPFPGVARAGPFSKLSPQRPYLQLVVDNDNLGEEED